MTGVAERGSESVIRYWVQERRLKAEIQAFLTVPYTSVLKHSLKRYNMFCVNVSFMRMVLEVTVRPSHLGLAVVIVPSPFTNAAC